MYMTLYKGSKNLGQAYGSRSSTLHTDNMLAVVHKGTEARMGRKDSCDRLH